MMDTSQSMQEIWEDFYAAPSETSFLPLFESSKGLIWTLCCPHSPSRRGRAGRVSGRLLPTAGRRLGIGRRFNSPRFRTGLIYRTAIKEANRIRIRRRRQAQREVNMDALPEARDPAPAADELAERAQTKRLMEALVAELPERFRLPIQLHYFNGLSQVEIARMMGRTKSSISRRLAKGLRLLEAPAAKAGWSRAMIPAALAAAGAGLLKPPAALAALAIFAKIRMMAAASGGGAFSLARFMSGLTTAAKVKIAVTSTLAIVGLGSDPHSRYQSRIRRRATGRARSGSGRGEGTCRAIQYRFATDAASPGSPSGIAGSRHGNARRARHPFALHRWGIGGHADAAQTHHPQALHPGRRQSG